MEIKAAAAIGHDVWVVLVGTNLVPTAAPLLSNIEAPRPWSPLFDTIIEILELECMYQDERADLSLTHLLWTLMLAMSAKVGRLASSAVIAHLNNDCELFALVSESLQRTVEGHHKAAVGGWRGQQRGGSDARVVLLDACAR
jgi:hypothetical protein